MTLVQILRASSRRLSVAAWFALLALVLIPPTLAAEEGPSRLIPAKGLTVYIEYEGVGAHADAWNATAAHALWSGTPAGETLTSVARQIVDQMLKISPDLKMTGADLTSLCEHLFRHGFLFALYGGDNSDSGVLVLKGFGRKESRPQFERLIRLMTSAEDAGKPSKPFRIRGRDLYQWKAPAGSEPAFPKQVRLGGVEYKLAMPAESPPGIGAQAIPPVGGVPPVPAGAEGVPPGAQVPASPPTSYGAPPAPVGAEGVPPGAQVPASPPTSYGAPASPPGAQVPVVPPGAQVSVGPPGAEVPVLPPNAGPPESLPDAPSTLLTWWFEGDDLIVTGGPPLDGPAGPPKPSDLKKAGAAPKTDRIIAVLDAIEGKAPNASTHPGRKAALAEGADIKEFVPNGLFFIESSEGKALLEDLQGQLNSTPMILPGSLPAGLTVGPVASVTDAPAAPAEKEPKEGQAAPAEKEPKEGPAAPAEKEPKKEIDAAKVLGLDRFTRILGRWGFRGKALMTDVRLEIPAPRTGLLAFLDQPGFPTSRLPSIPKEARAFALGSFLPGKSYDTLIKGLKALDPDSAGEVEKALREIQEAVRAVTGQRLREDLLDHLGPTWCFFTTPYQWDDVEVSVPTLRVDITDGEAFGKVLDELASRVNLFFQGARDGEGNAKGNLPPVALERLPAPERGYRITSPEGVVPWLSDDIQPTIMLGKSYLVVAMNPALARATVSAESRDADRWVPGDEVSKTLASLPAGVTSLSVGDPRDSMWPTTIARLPKTVQFLGHFLVADATVNVEANPTSAFLALLGVPEPGGFRIRINPAKVPKARQVRSLLFPSVLATAVDDRGIRFIGTEALPFTCIGYQDANGNLGQPTKFKIDLNQLMNFKPF